MISKKIIGVGAGGLICAGIVAAVLCFGGSHNNTSPDALKMGGETGLKLLEQIETTPDLSAALNKTDEFVPMEVKKAFIDGGGCAKVIVHNNTQTPITSYTLQILYFDEKGKPLDTEKEYTVDNIVIPSLQDFGLDSYVGGSNDGSYIKAVVSSVSYNDGTGWINEKAPLEIAGERTAFNIDEYRHSIEKNEENVKKAASTPYLYINKMTIASSDQISARKELKLVLTNTGDKEIREIKAAVAEFDKNNKPVDVSPQIYIGKNIRLATCSGMELQKDESRSFSASAFLEKDCFRINAIITEITFADGTVWKNPYALDWLLWFM